MDTKKLFHAIVVMGMTAAAACSSGTPDPNQDASADTGGGGKDSGTDGTTKDVTTTPDTGGPDTGGDSATGWLGC
jgi:hypothetical protein